MELKDPVLSKDKDQRTALIVLGMHRSGTSALAGALANCGFGMPQDLMAPSDMNAKGFFESNSLTMFNEKLLDKIGVKWWFPNRLGDCWHYPMIRTEVFSDAISIINSVFCNHSDFVIKDPRMCRLLPFWHEVLYSLNIKIRIIHTHRHPLYVGQSLKKRAGYSPNYSYILWVRYLLEAEYYSRGTPRSFTSYKLIMDKKSEAIASAVKGLVPESRYRINNDLINQFISGDLENFSGDPTAIPDENVPDMALNIYNILEFWSINGERKGDYLILDFFRNSINSMSGLYDCVAVKYALLQNENNSLKELIAEFRHEKPAR